MGSSNFGRVSDFFRSAADRDVDDALKKAVIDAARRLAKAVQEEYRSQTIDFRSLSSQIARRGKDIGAERPAKPPVQATHIGGRLLARHVVVQPMQGGLRVRIDPNATHPSDGRPLELIARWREKPRKSIFQRTLRMHSYLYLIRKKRGGYGTRKTARHLPDRALPGLIVFQPEAKPVWAKVIARWKETIDPSIRVVVQTLGKVAVKYGARQTGGSSSTGGMK